VDGVGLIEGVRAIDADAEVVLLLNSSDPLRAVVAAMKAGAVDLLLKPVDRPALREQISRIGGVQPLTGNSEGRGIELRRRYDLSRIEGNSPQMLAVLSLAGRVARHNTPVLITGESGTGKELLARAIHVNSQRAGRSMVSINCAAIPEPLLESELFGYRRGAFTGANADKPGLLTTADGGTLFLDEVAELPLSTQAKLLRFLEDGAYFPLGGVRPLTGDVRLIAATNASLPERLATGAFRRDLYYRLSVFPLYIPPLRERPQDIVPLAEHFLHQLGAEVGKKVPGLSREAVRYMTSRSWRGNARELKNAVERAVIVSNGNLLTSVDFRTLEADLQSGNGLSPAPWELPEEGVDLGELNRTLIAAALERSGFNISAAARLLRITRPTLRHRMEKYGLAKNGRLGGTYAEPLKHKGRGTSQ
jgi:DNA-binding NtrC family response regulator